ncbi:MAG: cytochrome c3 family protein [Acidobacteriota bacterium]|jgi:predicted CXXCH cytochrome family protein
MNRKLFKTFLLVVSAAALATGAYAFHDGGVAECSGCHSMHAAASPTFLLVNSDPSSTCLSCHENSSGGSYHISTPASYFTANPTDGPLNKTPGGDFGWLRLDRTAFASYGAPLTFLGEEQGHNVVASDFGYVADTTPNAPGGTMPSNQLKCTSCHDKHGQGRITGDATAPTIQTPVVGGTYDPIFGSGSYGTEYPAAGEAVGTYRLLPGDYYDAWDSVSYPGVPAAIVPSSYNRSEASTTTRTAYGYSPTDASGFASWGRWCATCHPAMHTDTAGFKHKVDDQLPSGIVTNYNSYVMSGDLTGVFPRGGPFTSLVPFSKNTKDMTALAALALTDDSDMSGPDTTDRLNCLTCHRAHASAWKWSLRWNGDAEFLTLGTPGNPVYPGVDTYPTNAGQFNAGYTEEQMTDAYYGRAANREFAAHQRSLCNKCHVKD